MHLSDSASEQDEFRPRNFHLPTYQTAYSTRLKSINYRDCLVKEVLSEHLMSLSRHEKRLEFPTYLDFGPARCQAPEQNEMNELFFRKLAGSKSFISSLTSPQN